MTNVAIYYRMSFNQKTEEVISEIEKLIAVLNENISLVFIDNYNESEKFNTMVDEELISINILYINKKLEDDFENLLIKELARTYKFEIQYFS